MALRSAATSFAVPVADPWMRKGVLHLSMKMGSPAQVATMSGQTNNALRPANVTVRRSSRAPAARVTSVLHAPDKRDHLIRKTTIRGADVHGHGIVVMSGQDH